MITSKVFSSKQVFILGMGVTGKAIARSLYMSGAKVFFWDDNNIIRNKYRGNKYKIFENKKSNWKKIDFLVVSPGIKTKGIKAHKVLKLAKENRCRIVSELDLFQKYLENYKHKDKIKVVGVTGTNGKSTVVTLVNHILNKNNIPCSLVGNIGKSIFSSKELKEGVYIMEISSYQLENSNLFAPDYACVLNLGADHIDRHGSIKNYAKNKLKIFRNLDSNQFGIINANHKELRLGIKKFSKLIRKRIINVDFQKNFVSFYDHSKKCLSKNKIVNNHVSNPHLSGDHNKENIFFAVQISELLDIRYKRILNAIKSFNGLEHRQELVHLGNKILIINDSKATNFESLIPALKNYKNIYLICGGLAKDDNIKVLNKYINQLVMVFIIGLNKEPFFNYFNKRVETFYVRNLSKAVSMALSQAKESKSDGTILFSPGAASFDQFKNFESRGKRFKRVIKSNKNYGR
tara:strand:- start:232 stop:1614 length:1383 start_codon:yes stop_codon:yes gene_type:complete